MTPSRTATFALISAVTLFMGLRLGTGCAAPGEKQRENPAEGQRGVVKSALKASDSGAPVTQAAESAVRAMYGCEVNTVVVAPDAGADGGLDAALSDVIGLSAPTASGDGGTVLLLGDAAVTKALPSRVGEATTFEASGDDYAPRFADTDSTTTRVDVRLPAEASGSFTVRDRAGDKDKPMAIRAALSGAKPAPAEMGDGHLVYRGAHPSGGDVMHRASRDGTEDYVAVLGAAQGSAPEIVYDVTLENVAGVRLVEQVVEFLDRDGVPRLRMAAPLVRDANCTRVLPKVTVVGVALTNAAGDLPVAPGAPALQIKVGWNDQGLTYPVVVDPSWTTTMVMSTAVELPAYVSVPATVLKPDGGVAFAKGDVIVAGGTTRGVPNGPVVATERTQVFRWATKVWQTLANMPAVRQYHTLNLTGAAQNQIIAVGGQNSANDYMMTTPVYSLVDGVWTTPTQQLKEGRVSHRSVTLNDGRVMVTGGHSPARVNVELYNPTNDSWLYNGTKLALGRINHTAVTLADGRVFVAGGWSPTTGLHTATTELITPDAGQSTAPTTNAPAGVALPNPMEWMAHVRAPTDNRVILAGGGAGGPVTTTVLVYVPAAGAAGSWSTTTPPVLPSGRASAGMALLGTAGRVFLGGGWASGATPETAFTWEYGLWAGGQTGQTWQTTSLATSEGHNVPIVASGWGYQVLVAGGARDQAGAVSTQPLSELGDFCDQGCTDNSLCTTDTCSATGCVNTTTVVCTNNNVCDGLETCVPATGACQAGTPLNCVDSNPCTKNLCDPVAGCSNPPEPNTVSCDDGFFCNGTSMCNGSGTCVAGTPPTPPTSGDPCMRGPVCNEALDNFQLATGTACDDGNVCTTASACSAGGVCTASTFAALGAACADDGNACNGNEICNGTGTCFSGVTPSYPSDPCFDITCNPATGTSMTLKSPPPAGCAVTNPTGTTDPSVPTDVADLAGHLIASRQTNVTGGIFAQPDRISIISGRVLTNTLTPAGNVVVKVVGQPDFGQTLTLSNGRFDLVVNGGATYVLSIVDGSQSFEIQRHVSVGWQDWNVINDVVLTPTAGSLASTPNFTLPTGGTYTLVKGPASTDADGTRTPVMILPPAATVTSPAGLTGPFNIGFSEYTVGGAGAARMPGDLPPASGYTYALALRLATNAGISFASGDVTFAPAATPIFYVNNFVGFPVGEVAPAGSYDPVTGQWLASNTSVAGAAKGRVVKIASGCTGTTGTAVLDTDNNATNDATDSCMPGSVPPCSGGTQIPGGERDKLCAAGYGNGTSLWRVPMLHFTDWDANWGFGPPNGAAPPGGHDPNGDPPDPDPDPCVGSIIGCQNQSLGEELPIAGTPYKLRYQSDWQAGRQVPITVPITGSVAPPSVGSDAPIRIDVIVRVAGRILQQSVAPTFNPNQSVRFVWDRLDALGRFVAGSTLARVEVGNVYRGQLYKRTGEFGYSGNGTAISGDRVAREVTLWKHNSIRIDRMGALPFGLGGWTLNAQHVYDRYAKVLYMGEGRVRRMGDDGDRTISTVVTTPPSGTSGFLVTGVGVDPDGALIVANNGGDPDHYRVRRYPAFPPNTASSVIAGNGTAESAGDTGSCTMTGGVVGGTLATAQPLQPVRVATASDRSIFVLTDRGRLRRIFNDPQGSANWYMETVAGTGVLGSGCSGQCNGVLGRTLNLTNIVRVAVAPDGAVYLADGVRIRKLVQDKYQPAADWVCGHPPWIASTVVGGGATSITGAGVIYGINAALSGNARGMAFAPDGTLFFAAVAPNAGVWAMEPSGRLRRIAGTTTAGGSGDGGLAVDAQVDQVNTMAWLQGNLYLLDSGISNLRVIDPRGFIHSVTKNPGATGAQGVAPAQQGALWQPEGLAVAPDGSLYVGNKDHAGVRAIRPPTLAGCIADSTAKLCLPSEDGSEVYGFDDAGRHIWTKAALGGAKTAQFQFPVGGGLPTSITDITGKVTQIARTASSVTFTAPFGQQTVMALDGSGYATQVRYTRAAPSTFEDWTMTYKPGSPGLLQTFKKPGNAVVSTFGYDGIGRLIADRDPEMTGTPQTTLAVTLLPSGREVALTTAEGHTYRGKFETPTTGGESTTFTDAAGISRVTTIDLRGAKTVTELGGALVSKVEPGAAGTRFGMLAPENTVETVDVAGNLHQTALQSTSTRSSTATLSNANDVFSTTAMTETTVRGGKINLVAQPNATWTTASTVAAGVVTSTTTSPAVAGWAARTVERKLDAKKRVEQIRVPGYPSGAGLTTAFTYVDAACAGTPVGTTSCGGRLSQVAVSSPGETTRTTSMVYGYGLTAGPDPGFLSATLDPEGYRTTFGAWNGTTLTASGRDGLGRVTKITRTRDTFAPSFVTDLGYDLNGNVSGVTPPGKPAHTLTSTGVDLLGSYAPPDLTPTLNPRNTIYDYNDERAVTLITEPWAASTTKTLTFGYDSAGRSSTLVDAVTGFTTTRGYDGVGRLSSLAVSGPNGVTLTEDYAGRLPIQTTYSGSVAALLLRTFDHEQRQTKRIVKQTAGGTTYPVTMGYALDGLLASVKTRTPNDVADSATLTYTTRDAIGRTTLATLTSSAATVNETATYNGFGEPKTQKTCSGGTGTTCTGGTTFYEVTSTTRDKLGRITALTETTAIAGGPGASTVAWGYSYDEAGRLKTVDKTSAAQIAYTYDANGNRLTATGGEVITTGTIDGQDRLASQTRAGVTTTYTYTNNGSMLTSTSPTAAWTYAYDLQGNLRSATKSGTSITYLVDGRNRRVGKTGTGATLPAKYVYDDQLRIVAELDVTSGAPTHVYAYGEKSNVPELVYQPATAKTYRIVSDVRGSVRLVLELPASGTPVVRQRIDYDAWGNATESVNTTTPPDANFKRVSLGYAGGLWDRDTGFVRFGARDYDPNTGRWTAKDPIRFDGGGNLYAYAHSDPINETDPTGMDPDGFGTNNCEYYTQRCAENRGSYYCIEGPKWCDRFPKQPPGSYPGNWARCTRDCLQVCDAETKRRTPMMCPVNPEEPDNSLPWTSGQNFGCHAACYAGCALGAVFAGGVTGALH